MYNLRFSGQYPEPIKKELTAMLSAIRAWMTTEHNEDGEHTAEASTSVVLEIPAGTVSYSQLQDASAASILLGRGSALGSGNIEEISLGASLGMSGTTLNVAAFASSTWTPIDSSGAGLTFAAAEGRYVRLGPLVLAVAHILYPATGDTNPAVIGGLPATSQNTTNRLASGLVVTDAGTSVSYQVNSNATSLRLVNPTSLNEVTVATMSNRTLSVTALYLAA
jgi:hypothetical protein